MKVSEQIKEQNMTVPIGGLYPIQTAIGASLKRKKVKKYLTKNLDINYLKYDSIREAVDLPENIKSKIVSSDEASFSYKFRKNRPQGIIISDTYNNPVFPIDYPRIDNSKIMLFKLRVKFQELYSGHQLKYLPWHYIVEMVEGRYVVFNTRPIDVRFPINNNDATKIIKDNGVKLNAESQKFFDMNAIDIQECIHIGIIGDSYHDLYSDKVYKLIGTQCIHPILQLFRLSKTIGHSVHVLNMGDKFKSQSLEKYIKK
jgi:hypothetical protein